MMKDRLNKLFVIFLVVAIVITYMPQANRTANAATRINYQTIKISSSALNGNSVWGLTEGEDGVEMDNSAHFFANKSGRESSGFPVDGKLTVSGIPYQFSNGDAATAYDGNDSIRLYSSHLSQTMTLETIGVYQKIYVLATAGGPGAGNYADFEVQLNYTDDSSEKTGYKLYDWFDSTPVWIDGELMGQYPYFTRKGNGVWGSYDGSTSGGPILFSAPIKCNSGKLLKSITFNLKGLNGYGSTNNLYCCIYAVTGATPGGVPDAPGIANFTDYDPVSGSAILKWNAPEDETVTGYYIDVATDPEFKNMVEGYNNKELEGTENSYEATITGFTPNKPYYYRVRSKNVNGQSLSSETMILPMKDWAYEAHLTSEDLEYDNVENTTIIKKDINLTDSIKLKDNEETIIDLNGHEINAPEGKPAFVGPNGGKANLTIKDSTRPGGKVNGSKGQPAIDLSGSNGGTLVIDGVTIKGGDGVDAVLTEVPVEPETNTDPASGSAIEGNTENTGNEGGNEGQETTVETPIDPASGSAIEGDPASGSAIEGDPASGSAIEGDTENTGNEGGNEGQETEGGNEGQSTEETSAEEPTETEPRYTGAGGNGADAILIGNKDIDVFIGGTTNTTKILGGNGGNGAPAGNGGYGINIDSSKTNHITLYDGSTLTGGIGGNGNTDEDAGHDGNPTPGGQIEMTEALVDLSTLPEIEPETQVMSEHESTEEANTAAEQQVTPAEPANEKAEEYTVPVENATAIQVGASITDGNAVISEISDEEIRSITTGTEDDEHDHDKRSTITIDLTGAEQDVKALELSKTSVERLADATRSNENEINTVTVQLTNATVTMDARTLQTLAEDAAGETINLVVDNTITANLAEPQVQALSTYDAVSTFEAYFESNGKRIHDFKGGYATVSLKFTPNKNFNHYHVYYVAPDGELTRFATGYKDGFLSFATPHFSDYAIVYNEDMANETNEMFEEEDKEPANSANLKANGKSEYANWITINSGLTTKTTRNGFTVGWAKVEGADGYEVYGEYCSKFDWDLVKTVGANTTSVNITKIRGVKIDTTKNFKFYVAAYKMVDGKKERLCKTLVSHVAGANNAKYTNVKKVNTKIKAVSVEKGRTFTIKASCILENNNKKMLSDHHAATFRFASSNKKVATVDASGKIIARSNGTCDIWVYAKNGNAAKITVTVK